MSSRTDPLFPMDAPSGNHKERRTLLPAPWRRIDGTHGKMSAKYAHPRGWLIEHCGHPTALWPYALTDPSGEMVLAVNGRAFRTLQLAAAHVAQVEGGRDADA